MLEREREWGKPVESMIIDTINRTGGWLETARVLGLTQSTMRYWCMALGIEVGKRMFAKRFGEQIKITRIPPAAGQHALDGAMYGAPAPPRRPRST